MGFNPQYGTIKPKANGQVQSANSYATPPPAMQPPAPPTMQRSRPVAQAPKQPGVLSTPGYYEQWYNKWSNDPNRSYFQTPQKSYLESLYESGDQGYNKYWQYAHDQGQKDLSNRLASMGVLSSGAAAQAMGNMDTRFGAMYGQHMADLAGSADQERSRRLSDYWSGVKNEGDLAKTAQNTFQERERLPLQDKGHLAEQLSGIFSTFSTRTADEQKDLFEQVVQAEIANGTVDRQAAEQAAEDLFKTYGIIVRAADMRGGRASGPGVSNPDILPPAGVY